MGYRRSILGARSPLRHRRRAGALLGLVTLAAACSAGDDDPVVIAVPESYYVDCTTGSDRADGLTIETAWSSLGRANTAALAPGESLRLKRGCTWDSGERLIVAWSGTEAAPITIGAYGDGARPKLMNGRIETVRVTGSHLIIENLSIDNEPTDFVSCAEPYEGNTETPVGAYYGINITEGGNNVMVRGSLMQHSTVGLHISKTAGGFNRIIDNQFTNNDVMQEPFGVDLGAWGLLIRTDDNEIARNWFSNNVAKCGDGVNRFIDSNSVEIFEGSRNSIHHNVAHGDRVFSELGSSETVKASDNYYGFNTIVSELPGSRFVNTRGPDDEEFGPVFSTVVEHNTVIFTGELSEPIICSAGCSPDIISVRNNVFQTPGRAFIYAGTIDMSNNIVWGGPDGDGSVVIQDDTDGRQRVPMGTTDPRFTVADPEFDGDSVFRLSASSPALDAAEGEAQLNSLEAPVGDGRDLGAWEFSAARPAVTDE